MSSNIFFGRGDIAKIIIDTASKEQIALANSFHLSLLFNGTFVKIERRAVDMLRYASYYYVGRIISGSGNTYGKLLSIPDKLLSPSTYLFGDLLSFKEMFD